MFAVGRKLEASLALAGGGCKAFYALGFCREMREWGVRFSEISGVSAGAAMALCILSGTEDESVEYFEAIVARNPSNFRLTNIWRRERTFPHEEMYRRTIRAGMRWDKMKASGSKIFIHAVKALPKTQGLSKFRMARLISETARAFVLDDRDKTEGIPSNRIKAILQKWNMEDVTFTEKHFIDPNMVEQIIMNSSSIPPIVDFQSVGNEYYLDGGLTNNLLIEKFSPKSRKIGIYYEPNTIFGKNSSLLEETLLIRPSEPIPITSFDYTNPKGIRDTYNLGRTDANYWKQRILSHLDPPRFFGFRLPSIFGRPSK